MMRNLTLQPFNYCQFIYKQFINTLVYNFHIFFLTCNYNNLRSRFFYEIIKNIRRYLFLVSKFKICLITYTYNKITILQIFSRNKCLFTRWKIACYIKRKWIQEFVEIDQTWDIYTLFPWNNIIWLFIWCLLVIK